METVFTKYSKSWHLRKNAGLLARVLCFPLFQLLDSSSGALDFEMGKNSRKLIVSGKLLEGA